MIKFIVKTTLLGTDTGRQRVSFPVTASTAEGALAVARTRLDAIVADGDASGYTTPTAKAA